MSKRVSVPCCPETQELSRALAGGAGHPARYQLLVGLARYATDIRMNKDSGSATNTAMRFAEGKTTVEAFEE